jgi:transposase
MRPKGSAKELEARRMLAAKRLQEGKGVRAIARLVEAAPSSVSRWKQELDEGGLEALKAKPHPGRRARLSTEQKKRLEQILLKGPQAEGFATDLWTLARVAKVIEREFGVKYHPGHVWYILRGMGWSCQKPERRARERDEAAIEQWRTKEWGRIKKKPVTKAGALS